MDSKSSSCVKFWHGWVLIDMPCYVTRWTLIDMPCYITKWTNLYWVSTCILWSCLRRSLFSFVRIDISSRSRADSTLVSIWVDRSAATKWSRLSRSSSEQDSRKALISSPNDIAFDCQKFLSLLACWYSDCTAMYCWSVATDEIWSRCKSKAICSRSLNMVWILAWTCRLICSADEAALLQSTLAWVASDTMDAVDAALVSVCKQQDLIESESPSRMIVAEPRSEMRRRNSRFNAFSANWSDSCRAAASGENIFFEEESKEMLW